MSKILDPSNNNPFAVSAPAIDDKGYREFVVGDATKAVEPSLPAIPVTPVLQVASTVGLIVPLAASLEALKAQVQVASVPTPFVGLDLGATLTAAASARAVSTTSIEKPMAYRADLLWGASKHGKGENARFACYWVAKVLKKKFMWLTSEPASIPTDIKAMVRAGLGDILSIANHPHLLAIASSVLEGGKWPVRHKTPTGFVRDFTSKDATIRSDEYGMIVVDSLTSIGDGIVSWLADPINKAKVPMTPGKDKFWVSDALEGGSEVTWGGSSGTHIYFAQQRLQELVVASANLPVEKVLWIARERRGSKGQKKDKDGNIVIAGEPMIGPELPGEGAVPRVTGWFGGAYHVQIVDVSPAAVPDASNPFAAMTPRKDSPILEYRLYLRPHPDQRTGLMYDVGNRFPAFMNGLSAEEQKLDWQELLKRKKIPPYLVCSESRQDDRSRVHVGLNTVWQLEHDAEISAADDYVDDLKDLLAKFAHDDAKAASNTP